MINLKLFQGSLTSFLISSFQCTNRLRLISSQPISIKSDRLQWENRSKKSAGKKFKKSRKSAKYKKISAVCSEKKNFAQHSSREIFDKRKYKAKISAQKYLIKYAGSIAYNFLLLIPSIDARKMQSARQLSRLKEHTRIDL